MSDFFSNLIARSFSEQPAIRPRLPALFESSALGSFGETSSVAPTTNSVGKSALENPTPTIPKPFAKAQIDFNKPIVNETAAKKISSQKNEPTMQIESAKKTFSDSENNKKIEAKNFEFETKKIIVPVTSAFAEKQAGQHMFESRHENSFLPREVNSAAPIINVTIGRVEVRAIQSTRPAPKSPKSAPPKLSLDDYLQKREGNS